MNEMTNEFSGALILIIEDEPTQRLLTRDCLEEAGFRVEEEENGENGLSRIHEMKPDLVLLDVMLPGIDGFEVCKQIREDRIVGDTPIVLITGRDNSHDVKRGFVAGASDFFSKPVRWNLLPTRIESVLRTNRLERELRHSKEVAEKASAAKSTLLSTMGHELRTPLNAIIGFAELMKHKIHGPIGVPRYEEFVDDIHSAGSLLLGGINDVLEIVDRDGDEFYSGTETSELSELVGRAITATDTAAAKNDVRLETEIVPGSVLIRGDAARLCRAISNLLSNAVKFSPSGGTVRLGTRLSSENEFTLSVADDGIGINPQDIERIMEPFEQADNSISRSYEGMGLGLPLARSVVRHHGGELSLASTPGQGTTATISLPGERITTNDNVIASAKPGSAA